MRWLTYIPSAATIALTVIIAISITSLGIANLEKWQTLMASCIALVGGTLAYTGAMAKVELDREAAKEARYSRRAGVYFRLRYVLLQMIEDAEHIRRQFPRAEGDYAFDRNQLALHEPPELEEAWRSLDLFPFDASVRINGVRLAFRALRKSLPSGEMPLVNLGSSGLTSYRAALVDLIDAAREAKKEIEDALLKMHPDASR